MSMQLIHGDCLVEMALVGPYTEEAHPPALGGAQTDHAPGGPPEALGRPNHGGCSRYHSPSQSAAS